MYMQYFKSIVYHGRLLGHEQNQKIILFQIYLNHKDLS